MELRRVSVGAGLAAWLALLSTPALAQGSYQSVLSASQGGTRSYRLPAAPPYRSTSGWSAYSRYQPDQSSDDVQPYERDETVRTLCVRMCDGFYFPISSTTLRSGLARDADKCNAMCSAEAQLFYHSTAGGSVDTMVDLTGRAYSSFPNAYKYRKTLVEGCRCRPQPWSETERQRHRAYEGRAAVAEAKPPPVVGEERTSGAADRPAEFHPFDDRSEAIPIDRSTIEQRDPVAPPPRADAGAVTVTASDGAIFRPDPIERQLHLPPPAWYAGSRAGGVSPYDGPADEGRRGR